MAKAKTIGELANELLARKFPEDPKQRTYLELMLEGLAKQAIKGDTEAAKLVLRYSKQGRVRMSRPQ